MLIQLFTDLIDYFGDKLELLIEKMTYAINEIFSPLWEVSISKI